MVLSASGGGTRKSDHKFLLAKSCVNSGENHELKKTRIENDSVKCYENPTLISSPRMFGMEDLDDNLSTWNFCVRYLQRHGLLEKPDRYITSEVSGISTESNFMLLCKVCGEADDTLNMLLCDSCDEAFHASCCEPKITKFEIEEWFCPSCTKKKREVLEEKTPRIVRGPIAAMLKYPEQHLSRVRIGKSFQAEVPDWSDQISSDPDCIGEPLEMDPAETMSLNVCDSIPSSLCNWLQCRAVLDSDTIKGGKGNICGKWRRAPFSEIQTSKWDCSCSVNWDPAHSDCAVPQELETDKVLAQLKLTTRLRSRITSRK